MLPYITHVQFLYKLIEYDYIEDLSKTLIVGIYTESHKDIIKKIVHIRRYNQHDYLISHNYYMIKHLFKNRYFKYYDLMIYYEKESILNLISIRDPLIGKIVYVSELDWKHLFLYDEQINQNYNLKQIIIDKQNELVDLYFNETFLRTL